MYEHSLRERAVGRVGHLHALPRQRLQDVPVVQVVVVRIRVHVGQREAVQLRVGQPAYYGRFQVFLILELVIIKVFNYFLHIAE